jgi:hypothetical protein
MDMLIEFLVVTLIILMAIIAYRFLLRYLSKGNVDQAVFCELYSLDHDPAAGEISFYFVCPTETHVTFNIWESDNIMNKEDISLNSKLQNYRMEPIISE